MGRSAKVAKRVPKKLKSSALDTGSSANNTQQVQHAKKRASLKGKAGTKEGNNDHESLLGGADYVSLMMGGRQKARREAQKLPKDS